MKTYGKFLVRVTSVALALLALSTWGRIAGADFVRGDTNSDGSVTVADAHYLLNFLFRGKPPAECLGSTDANDDGHVNLTDAIVILNKIVDGRSFPPPFPEPGPDPTANADPSLNSCDSYGNGEILEDDTAKVQVLDAVADGGGDDRAVITIMISNSRDIAGYSGRIALEGVPIASYAGPTASGRGAPGDILGLENPVTLASVSAEEIYFGYLSTLTGDEAIPPGEDVVVMEIPVCLAEGTLAGDYPLPLVSAEQIDFESGLAISPRLLSGTLTVLADLDPEAGCEPGRNPASCDPPAWEPGDVNATFALGDGTAPPGGTVEVPFRMMSNGHTQAFSYSIDFDEEVLQMMEVEIIYEKPDGTEYDFVVNRFDNTNANPGSAGVDEGFAIGASVFSLDNNCNTVPPNTEAELLRLHFEIRSEAVEGATELRFQDGGQILGGPVRNMLTVNNGTGVTPETANSWVFVHGFINVAPDGTLFIRGDSNGDTAVDLSDALATLGYLFLGTEELGCPDAADADDDGILNIVDPVITLQRLFLGGNELPPPTGDCGDDPTGDDFAPCFSPGCAG